MLPDRDSPTGGSWPKLYAEVLEVGYESRNRLGLQNSKHHPWRGSDDSTINTLGRVDSGGGGGAAGAGDYVVNSISMSWM